MHIISTSFNINCCKSLNHLRLKPLSKILSFYSSSILPCSKLPHYKTKLEISQCKWRTNHIFVQTNALLSLLEIKCKYMTQLKQIQSQMIITGLFSDGFASSRLIAFCALSEKGNLNYCKKILYNMENPNTFSWNMAIRGCGESENPKDAIFLYKQMLNMENTNTFSWNMDIRGCSVSENPKDSIFLNKQMLITKGSECICLKPDNHTFPLLLKICSRLDLYYMGQEILVHILRFGHDQDVFVHNAMIHFLVSCGKLEDANKLFDESSMRDLVSWNSLINGYVRTGRPREALMVFEKMKMASVEPDEVTIIGIVGACGQLKNLELGRRLHSYVMDTGLNIHVPLCNALIDMYVKNESVHEAKALFDRMEERTMVSWTTMISGFAKLGLLDAARRLFNEMPEKAIVQWNALIGGYVQAKCGKEALALFHEMQTMNVKPDEVTMVSCLSACAQLGALDIGFWIHHYIKKHKLCLTVSLGTALVDMYAKCGNVEKALQIFHEMPVKNSLTWTAAIGALAFHGNGRDALSYFSKMVDGGLIPDDVTFLGVLSACCHGGLVEEGQKLFAEMSANFKIPPKSKHYCCMVDLLGRAGLLHEVYEFVQRMPMAADASIWGALFFACRVHGNVEMGEKAALKLLEFDPGDSGTYVLLANMYVEANMRFKARDVRKMMDERGLEKTPGCSSIEVNGKLFEFIVRDKTHPRSDQIYESLIHLTRHMEIVNCFPFTGYDLLLDTDVHCSI
ncbi:pentatricopeptide repeat-containing protein At2g22410, mitochondrial-like [Nicotiana tabacum]|uniref:Pentatricopeptide repeat-containing protein At2g22410, mitochondrial-like n=1 Tax=Nicotiana tabacum TaxID=4097 RepID=A0A1S3ZDW1_TOBAC|nr:PREDICTED: pentatricopeptide repeat-containing protein At2g22410, mitochondrial-like [Nicotiana tabacum]